MPCHRKRGRIKLRLFCFGAGYVATHVASLIVQQGGSVSGTRRLAADNDALFAWQGAELSAPGRSALQAATHILISVPPDAAGCPVQRAMDTLLPESRNARWIGYLSTTGVYGDTNGAWVDEETPVAPQSARAHERVLAETQWRDWGTRYDVPVQIFRLSGIYGPSADGENRSPFDRIASGDGQIIDARDACPQGHVFNRVHVNDIARIILAGMQDGRDGVFNVSDDLPASQMDVMRFAYELLGLTPPDAVPLAAAKLSPMGRDFYRDCKRVCNEKIKRELGVTLRYPTYVEGLAAIYRDTVSDNATRPSA